MSTKINKKSKIVIAAVAVSAVAAIALSSISIGFAAWKTEIKANGKLSANSSWDVKVTAASLETSSGAQAVESAYSLERTKEKDDALLASTICSSTWVSNASLMGTQSNDAMSLYVEYYAVDTTKYSLDTIKTYTTKEQMNAMRNDSTTVTIAKELKAYYRYVTGLNDGSPAAANSSAKAVINGLLADSEKMLQEKHPETYKDYMLIYVSGLNSGIAKSWTKYCYTIADFAEKSSAVTGDTATFTDTDVSYASVNYSLPGSWAKYTMSVTNNGTVDACLSGSEIKLDGDSSIFTLESPNLDNITVSAGKTVKITFVVKAKDTEEATLNGNANVSVSLEFDQPTVEAAPSPTVEIK